MRERDAGCRCAGAGAEARVELDASSMAEGTGEVEQNAVRRYALGRRALCSPEKQRAHKQLMLDPLQRPLQGPLLGAMHSTNAEVLISQLELRICTRAGVRVHRRCCMLPLC